MTDLLEALVQRTGAVDRATWAEFWDRLHERRLREGQALAVLASLSTRMPDALTLGSFLDSLADRAAPVPATWPGTVNLVGTGGGPATFNLTTAAALVAATTGVRVVKTGSRGYTSRYGSVDILNRLGLATASSYSECEDLLARHNLAFASGFVYPVELTELSRAIVPYGLRQVGRFVNRLGPFLGAVPVEAQLTGVSDPELCATFTELVATRANPRIWLVRNELGIDELVSFVDNTVLAPGARLTIGPGSVGLAGAGTVTELRPAGDGEPPEEQLLALVAGRGPAAAIESICLNAAAAAVVSGLRTRWDEAYRVARQAVADGAALELAHRLREVAAGV